MSGKKECFRKKVAGKLLKDLDWEKNPENKWVLKDKRSNRIVKSMIASLLRLDDDTMDVTMEIPDEENGICGGMDVIYRVEGFRK